MDEAPPPSGTFVKLRSILRRALDLTEADRGEFLARECQDDGELQARLESILEGVDSVPAVLATAGVEQMLIADDPGAAGDDGGASGIAAFRAGIAGPEIPGYTLTGQLGEGGMGIVYAAQQHRPRRQVAIKVIRGGSYVTAMQVRLFQRESQALARLRHPSIAAIYEVGRTAAGEHFFVMDLVHGEDLASFVRSLPLGVSEHRTNLRARLELFLKIVDAVAYAHQRGVLHRDLKPANVIVARAADTRADIGAATHPNSFALDIEVKLLDFGLARITDADVQMTTVMTSAGNVMGTLAYMSPEQARGNPDEIDVRSDLYSLGVMLFEILTGRLPIEVDGLPLFDAVQRICGEEPARAGSIRRSLRGDLETVVGKAIDKDPERRYQSANALADDIRRFLGSQPILARPPSATYQLRKLVARYRALVFFLATLFFLVLGSAVAMSILWQGQRSERRKAVAAEAVQTERLWESLLSQARATRFGGAVGRRFVALEAIGRAAEIRPSRELRREAIASMAQVDLRPQGAPFSLGLFTGNANVGLDGEFTRFVDPQLNGGFMLRGAATGDTIREFPSPGRVLYSRFDAAGRYVAVKYIDDVTAASRNHEHTFRLWNVEDGSLLLEVPTSSSMTLDLSSDGKLLAVGHSRSRITVYSLEGTGAPREFATLDFPNLYSIRFSPDGSRLVMGGRHRVEVREVKSGRIEWSTDLPATAFDVAWNRAGDRIAVACTRFHVHVFDLLAEGELRRFEGHESEVTRVSFDSSGRWVVSSAWDRTTRVWDCQTGEEVIKIEGYLCGVTLSGERVATQSGDLLQMWELTGERGLSTYHGHDPGAKRRGTLDFAPRAHWLASAGGDGVRVWSTATGQEQPQFEIAEAWAALFTPDASGLITAGVNGVHRWPVTDDVSGFQVGPAVAFASEIQDLRSASLTRDGQRLAVLSQTGQIAILDLADPGGVMTLTRDSAAFYVAIDPAGGWVAASGPKPWVKIWNADHGSLVASLDAPGINGGNIAVSPDGQWLVYGTESECSIWEVATWSRHRTISRDPDVPYHHGHVAIAPDSRSAAIATSSAVKLVTLPDGAELAILESPHLGRMSLLAFSDDGQRLAVGYEQDRVEVWDLPEIRAALRELKLDWAETDSQQPSPASQDGP